MTFCTNRVVIVFTICFLVDALKNEGFTTRLDLNPGEQISWKVSFEPKTIAVLNQEVQLEIGGWRKKYKILFSATCDLPRIDSNPRSMFEKVI